MSFRTHALNAFWRALYPLNFLLILIFCVQAVFFYALNRREFSLPEFVNEAVVRAASKYGFDLRYSSASISVDGRIKINDVTLRAEGTPSAFFSAEKIDLSLWLTRLFNGETVPRNIRVYNGSLGDTIRGVDEAVVSHLYLSVSKSGQWWSVDSSHFKIGKLTAYATVDISEKFSVAEFFEKSGLDLPESKGKAQPLPSRINAAFAALEKYLGYLDIFESPVCSARIFLSDAESSRGRIRFYSGEAVFPIKNLEARVENLRFGIRYDGGKISDGLFFGARAERFFCEGMPHCRNLSTSANLYGAGESIVLSNVGVSVGNMEYEGLKIDNVSLKKDYLDADTLGEDWYAFAAFDDYRFGARFSLDKFMKLSAEFSGSLDPKIFTGHKFFSDIPELKKFSFDRGISLKGNLNCDFVEKNLDASIDFEASDCVIMDIPVRRAAGKVEYDSLTGIIDASKLEVQTREGWKASGRFVQNIRDLVYKIYVDGSVRPMAISHFMAPWWSRVFKSFEFADGRFPEADFYVEGKWGSPDFIWCYGSAKGMDALYNGSKFDEFSLNVWVNPSRISLYDIRLRCQNRNAHGNVQWLYGAKGLTRFDRQTLFIVSGLSPAELVSLGGKDVSDIFEVVKFSEPPEITVSGLMRNPANNPDNLPDIFNVSGFAPKQTRIETAVLQNLRFSAKSDKILTSVDEASFEFCGGHADGKITLEKKDGKMLFDASAKASKMNQAEFTKFLITLDPSKDLEDSEEPSGQVGAAVKGAGENLQAAYARTGKSGVTNSKKEGAERREKGFLDGGESGLVDMTLSLKGDVADIAHSVGSGHATLKNPDLMKLNMFGVLSRAFAALRLPLGTFEITYANSAVRIHGGVVEFPDLEMGGDAMRIKGAASYDFVNDDIDAAMVMYPFDCAKGVIMTGIATLVSPISSVIQVTVDGKISDPSVGMQVKPLNLIQSGDKILENIRESL